MLIMGDRDFARIVEFVRDNYGINLEKKRALVQGRLALDIERKGFSSFAEYLDAAMKSPGSPEITRMIDRLSTNHTFFFREPACFDHMKNVAVPALIRGGARHIEIWCAACSTGQECYSAAIIMEDAIRGRAGVTYSILGSDICSEALKAAEAGIYPRAELANIPRQYRKPYCAPCGPADFGIAPELKRNISWKRINLVKPLCVTRPYHIIFCRNVMIYFGAATKERLTSELFNAVRGDGYVYVGSTETMDIGRTRFEYTGPSVFVKRRQ